MERETEDKKSFMLYGSYARQFKKLDDAAAGQLIKAIFAYVNHEPLPEIEDRGADMAFSFICSQLDRDHEKYNRRCEKNRNNAKLGGRPAKKESQTDLEKPNGFENNRSVFSETETAGEQTKISEKQISEKIEHIEQSFEQQSLVKEADIQQKRFDDFWKLYPKKTGKKGAWNIWKRLKPNEELFNRIISSLETSRSSEGWKRENGKYIPNPTTWLNQGRWDDEPVEILIETQKDQWNSAENPWRK